MKKYTLRKDETIVRDGRTLYRIQALRKIIPGVEKGTLGGYVEGEKNLSQQGNGWIFEEACAYEGARVEGNAILFDQTTLRGKAKLMEGAILLDQAIVQGEAKVGGRSRVHDQVVVGGKAEVKGWIALEDAVHVGGNACLEGDRKHYLFLKGTTMILGDTVIHGAGNFAQEEAILDGGIFTIGEEV